MSFPSFNVFLQEMGFALCFLMLLFGYLFYSGVELQVILILFSALTISLYAFLSAYYYDPNDIKTNTNELTLYNNIIKKLTGVSDQPEQLIDIINSLKLSLKHTEESNMILRKIKTHLQKDPIACIEATKLGLINNVLICLEDVLPNDIRMNNGIDIINQILHNDQAKEAVCKNYEDLKEIIDKLIIITKEFMMKTIPKKVVEVSSLFNDINNNKEQESNYDDDNVSFDKNIFEKLGYKLIIALGLLSTDSVAGQSCIGDKGGISLVLSCLKDFKNESESVTKWCYWALFHITLQNPPNKRELVVKDGLTIILKGLKSFPKVVEINQQGIALLCSILTDDPHSKMNLHDARKIALQNDIVDILHLAQKTFRDVDDIQATSKFILNTLISNWQY